MLNEADIVRRAVAGDIKAFELIVRQYERLVFSISGRLVGNAEDVKDLSQEVFLKVYKHLSSFQFEASLATWIARIAYFTSLNHLKKNQRQIAIGDTEDLDAVYFTNEHPEELTSQKDLRQYIHQLIDQMPTAYKTVLTLYHMHQFTYQEIEEATGMPAGTVKGYLFRARKLLKEKMDTSSKK